MSAHRVVDHSQQLHIRGSYLLDKVMQAGFHSFFLSGLSLSYKNSARERSTPLTAFLKIMTERLSLVKSVLTVKKLRQYEAFT